MFLNTLAAFLFIVKVTVGQSTCEPTTTIINQYYYGTLESINSVREPTEPLGPGGLQGSDGDKEACQCDDLQRELTRLNDIIEADECSSTPCQNDGTCIDQLNSYKCDCVPGSYGTNCEQIATSCEQIQTLYMGKDDGVFLLKPLPDEDPLLMYCDQSEEGGNWMVFQRRYNGKQDFYLDWEDYEKGFGSKYGEFWLGLESIHKLTTSMDCEMRVDMEDFQRNKKFAFYSTFRLGPAPGYVLSIGGYKGNAGDGLALHNNQKFSTKDNDQDLWSDSNCADFFKGAWWYKKCMDSNLNGNYNGIAKSVFWSSLADEASLRATKMMIRQKQ